MKLFNLIKISIFLSATLCTLLISPDTCFAQKTDSLQFVKIPNPTGRYSVGTSVFHLSDETRKMPVGESNLKREMMIQVWYPAKNNKRKLTADYLTNKALLAAMQKEKYLNLQPEVLNGWENIRTHSTVDAGIISSPRKFPLLIFSHGFGVSRANYTAILEELASHGYIVAAIDHPYAGLTILPDGRVLSFTADKRGEEATVERVESMAQDAVFVLDKLSDKNAFDGRFANRINFKKVGMFGHSLGGAAALEICRSSSDRFKACADLDGSVWGKVETEGVNRPYLVMLNVPGEARRPPEAMRKQRDAEWSAIVSKKNTRAYIVKIDGTFHFSFSDFPFIVPDSLLKKSGADISPQRGYEIISNTLREFFAFYLNEKKGELPKTAIRKDFKEVGVEVFN